VSAKRPVGSRGPPTQLQYGQLRRKPQLEHAARPFRACALLAGPTVHPRATLSNAAKVIQYAADNGIAAIDAECVKAAGELKAESGTPDFTEGIEGAL
jgi:hypothetical protein